MPHARQPIPLGTRLVHQLARGGDTRPKALAVSLGASTGTVWRSLRKLERAGMATRDQRQGTWRLVVDPDVQVQGMAVVVNRAGVRLDLQALRQLVALIEKGR